MEIWIGCFGDLRWHSNTKVEEVETFFIRYYRDLLTDNDKKKKTCLVKLPSISVVNLWYDKNENPWIRKPRSASFIQDVMVWENDNPQRLLTAAKLSEREE
ncbi:MAG: hypothetical protein HDT49_00780 [Lactobacillus sp.]|nr:hypothetical protein [Lactobacillus sp.]